MSSFYLSPNVEKVGKGLDILVKEKKQEIGYFSFLSPLPFSGGRSASQELRDEYKVRIEHKSGSGGAGGKKRENELSLDWIFTCSCKPELRHCSVNGDGQPAVYPICKHIGACLIVHFH